MTEKCRLPKKTVVNHNTAPEMSLKGNAEWMSSLLMIHSKQNTHLSDSSGSSCSNIFFFSFCLLRQWWQKISCLLLEEIQWSACRSVSALNLSTYPTLALDWPGHESQSEWTVSRVDRLYVLFIFKHQYAWEAHSSEHLKQLWCKAEQLYRSPKLTKLVSFVHTNSFILGVNMSRHPMTLERSNL